MNAPREKSVVLSILRISRPGLLIRKLHGSPFSMQGDPDLYGCYRGRAFAVECKRPGERATLLQEHRLKQWKEAGAITGVVHSADEFIALLGLEKDHA